MVAIDWLYSNAVGGVALMVREEDRSRAERALALEANRLLGGDAVLRADQPIGDAPRAAALSLGLRSSETTFVSSKYMLVTALASHCGALRVRGPA